MTRQLLDANSPPPLPVEGAPPLLPQAAAVEPNAASPVQAALPVVDALAGALPGWDLLPANGFVRRRR